MRAAHSALAAAAGRRCPSHHRRHGSNGKLLPVARVVVGDVERPGQELQDEEAEEGGQVDGAQQRRHQPAEELQVGVSDLQAANRWGGRREAGGEGGAGGGNGAAGVPPAGDAEEEEEEGA